MITISNAEFDQLVDNVLQQVPDEYRQYLENVVVEVHDRPSRALDAYVEDDEAPEDLLGLYIGVPLEDKLPTLGEPGGPDRILLFRENLCAMCTTRAELIDEIRVTLLHEIGHFFGMDEDQLDELGYG